MVLFGIVFADFAIAIVHLVAFSIAALVMLIEIIGVIILNYGKRKAISTYN